jgi:tetratricopeptide (TPR) repeat protein
MAYESWGEALAARNELDPAIEKYRAAHDRGPHWADPLKAWGDVLVRQGRTQEALLKYDEALLYAPNWVTLRTMREALAHKI